MRQANQLATSFSRDLTSCRQVSLMRLHMGSYDDEKIHVQTTGAVLTELYESLRNASQNAEENIQLVHAIERFTHRFFYFSTASKLKSPGNSLIIELTMAGYIPNDSISQATADQISDLIKQSLTLKKHLGKNYSRQQIESWVIGPLAVRIENLLNDHGKNQALANLAYNYFLNSIDIESISGERPAAYEATLYMAVQRALLGSEDWAIRLNLIERYGIPMSRYAEYARVNQQIDEAFQSKLFDMLVKLVSRKGAVFRVLGTASRRDDAFDQHVLTEKTMLGPFSAAIQYDYQQITSKVNRGILRSVLFLIISKFIIGIAIEVPYDIFVHGQVMWLPLAVNLLLPPIYMILLRLTLAMPDSRNTKALNREAGRILFQPIPSAPTIGLAKRNFGKIFNFLYLLVIALVFGGFSWILIQYAKFEWIHLAIFFVFISTASFLGFRLSRIIRQIEVGEESQTTASVLRDFIYMPFVAIGQKITETYSRFNIVSRALDMFVELPLKTIIGFLRRWGSFMSQQRDDL